MAAQERRPDPRRPPRRHRGAARQDRRHEGRARRARRARGPASSRPRRSGGGVAAIKAAMKASAVDHDPASRQKDRRETNPALSTRKLKLGTFQTNLDSGCVMSDLDGPARHHLAQYRRARAARRGDGVRGDRAGRALAGLRRRHQPARSRLRGLYLGRRASPPRPASPACSPPRTSRSITRSSPPSSRR